MMVYNFRFVVRMSDFRFAAMKADFAAKDAARNAQTTMENYKLRDENRALKKKYTEVAVQYENCRAALVECQTVIEKMQPYLKAYERIKHVAMDEWDPLIKVATLLKQTNPELFNELSEKCKTAAKTPADVITSSDLPKN
jgi:DNA repair exonuclease SbcCD ATPase subunit